MIFNPNEWLDLTLIVERRRMELELLFWPSANGVGSGEVQTMQVEFV